MPRHARLDAAGILHHVMIRSIARKEIFLGDDDRADFTDRLSTLLPETTTACYAWALLKTQSSIADVRQRLKTYFERYNSRRRYHGLGDRTPDEVHLTKLPGAREAA